MRLIILLVTVWGTIEMILARGMIYSFLKQLPIIRSLHVNVRFTSAFIIPLTIVGVLLVNRFFLEDIRRPHFYVAAVLTLMSLFSYFVISRDVYSLVFNMNIANATYEQMMSGETFPIQRIADVEDVDGFMENASSYKPYEALFGYELQTLSSELHPGEIFETSGDYF